MEETKNNVGEQKLLVEGKNISMAVLSYLGPLVIVSYITAKNDPFVKFHIKQGLIVLIMEVVAWLILGVMFFGFLAKLINIVAIVLSVIGIIRAVKGEEKELPFVGKYANLLKI